MKRILISLVRKRLKEIAFFPVPPGDTFTV
jgi:hypothetical protein